MTGRSYLGDEATPSQTLVHADEPRTHRSGWHKKMCHECCKTRASNVDDIRVWVAFGLENDGRCPRLWEIAGLGREYTVLNQCGDGQLRDRHG